MNENVLVAVLGVVSFGVIGALALMWHKSDKAYNKTMRGLRE